MAFAQTGDVLACERTARALDKEADPLGFEV
jgi:hypothetical protein